MQYNKSTRGNTPWIHVRVRPFSATILKNLGTTSFWERTSSTARGYQTFWNWTPGRWFAEHLKVPNYRLIRNRYSAPNAKQTTPATCNQTYNPIYLYSTPSACYIHSAHTYTLLNLTEKGPDQTLQRTFNELNNKSTDCSKIIILMPKITLICVL